MLQMCPGWAGQSPAEDGGGGGGGAVAVAWAAATAAGSGGCSSVCTSPLKGQLASKIYSYQASIAQILLESLHVMQ